MPYLSISANVVSIESAPSSFSSRTSLNMYSAGMVNSCLVSWFRADLRRASSQAREDCRTPTACVNNQPDSSPYERRDKGGTLSDTVHERPGALEQEFAPETGFPESSLEAPQRDPRLGTWTASRAVWTSGALLAVAWE